MQNLRRFHVIFLMILFNNISFTHCGTYEIAKAKEQCTLTGYRMQVSLPGCYDVTVDINTCSGTCTSIAVPFSKHFKMIQINSCCHVTRYQRVLIRLNCLHDNHYMHEIRSATGCSCRKC